MMLNDQRPAPQTELAVDVPYIPDGLRHAGLVSPIRCRPALRLQREGDCFVAEILPFDVGNPAYRNHLHVHERKLYLRPGQRVPLILSYRRSMMEFASTTAPYDLGPGDQVWLLGGDGYAGSFECGLPDYGLPVSARILGAIAAAGGSRPRNTIDEAAPRLGGGRHRGTDDQRRPLVLSVIGARMDCGKSTAIRSLTEGLRRRGSRVVAGKVTGFGCRYETTQLGADDCLDFTDYGLPSTCGNGVARIVEVAHRIVDDLCRRDPDVIVLEFGDAPYGPYHVDEVLVSLRARVDLVVFVAFDLNGVAGGLARLAALGVEASFVTGPVANTTLGVDQIAARFDLPAETNRGGMPRLLELIRARQRADRR